MCVMIVKGVLPKPDIIVMADTGRENPSTWEYLNNVITPYLAEHGMKVEIAGHELAKVDLRGHNGDLLLPVYTQTGKFKAFCSGEWKRDVVSRYLRSKGITGGIKWLGLAFDEKRRWTRLHGKVDGKWKTHCPLVDLMIDTQTCLSVIKAAGLPQPHHSSCWMCPHKRNAEWRNIRDNYPEEWQKAIELDEKIREEDREKAIWLHHSKVPLAMANIDVDESKKVVEQCTLGTCFV